MSDLPANYAERLNLQEQLVRIDRAREEALKFSAEQRKLAAEADKFRRDYWLAPLVVAAAVGAAAATLIGLLLR